MKKIQEWESKDPRNVIAIPDDVMRRLHHRVLIQQLNKKHLTCWCEYVRYDPEIRTLKLQYVLFDTSDRQQGITLTARRTLFTDAQFYGEFSATVLPITEEETQP